MKKYKMRDLGMLTKIVGIRVDRSEGRVKISQKKYAEDVLKRFRMSESKSVTTPMLAGDRDDVNNNDKREFDRGVYQSAVGSLIYLATGTRPDIAYAVSKVAKKCTQPTEIDWQRVKRIMRYLVGTVDYGIVYKKGDGVLRGYADAAYAEEPGRKSRSGYVYVKNGGAVSWRSKDQTIVATSSTEAEYISIEYASREAITLRYLMMELTDKEAEGVIIFEDNQSTIQLVLNPTSNERTKHIDVKSHAIRDRVKRELVKVKYCEGSKMTADILTKPLASTLFHRHRHGMGMAADYV